VEESAGGRARVEGHIGGREVTAEQIERLTGRVEQAEEGSGV